MKIKSCLYAILFFGTLCSQAGYSREVYWQVKDLVAESDIIATVVVKRLDKKNDDLTIRTEHPNSGGYSVRQNPDYDEFMDVEFLVSDILKADSRHLHLSTLTIPALKGVGRLPKPVSFITGARYLVFLEYQDPNRSLQSLRLISQTSGAVRLEGDKVIKRPPLLDGYPPKYREFNEPQLLKRVRELITEAATEGLSDNTTREFHPVDPNRIPEILTLISEQVRSNYDSIKTWQGRITNENIITIRGYQAAELLTENTDAEPNQSINEIQGLSNITLEFKIDVENDRFFGLSKCTEPLVYLDPRTDTKYPPSRWGPVEAIHIFTSENRIDIAPSSWPDITSKKTAIKQWPIPAYRTDPRGVFYIREYKLWFMLSQLAQALQTPGVEKAGVVIKKKSTGDHTTYRIEISEPGSDRPLSIVTLSSEVGFNRTHIKNWYDDGSLMSEATAEFIDHQGVFLPNKWKMSAYYPDGGLMRQEDCTVEHQQINTPIPESTFSAQNYLHDGDRFRDNIAGKDFEYKNGGLVELAKKSPQKQLAVPDTNDPNQSP